MSFTMSRMLCIPCAIYFSSYISQVTGYISDQLDGKWETLFLIWIQCSHALWQTHVNMQKKIKKNRNMNRVLAAFNIFDFAKSREWSLRRWLLRKQYLNLIKSGWSYELYWITDTHLTAIVICFFCSAFFLLRISNAYFTFRQGCYRLYTLSFFLSHMSCKWNPTVSNLPHSHSAISQCSP